MGLIAIFISLGLFYYFNHKARIKKEVRRDRLKEKHQDYLNTLISNTKKQDSPAD